MPQNTITPVVILAPLLFKRGSGVCLGAQYFYGIFGENRSDAAYFEKDRFFCVRFKREYN